MMEILYQRVVRVAADSDPESVFMTIKFKDIKSCQKYNFLIIKGQAGSLPSKQIVS
jgi:hypothetical protein